jgi:NitT/TauT family transport system substrate-binding protein
MHSVIHRRLRSVAFALTTLSTLASPLADAQEATRVRFTLDWKLQGVHAPFLVAQDRGYYREAGLEVTVDAGEGSAATVTRIMGGAYQAGFGDINAAIQVASQKPGEAPACVYMFYNRAPFVLIARNSSAIHTLKDIEGRTLGAPANSAAFSVFPVLARAAGLDPARIRWQHFAPNLQEQMLLRGEVDAIAAFNVTSYSNLAALRTDPDRDYRWIFYGDHGLSLYSNCLMVSRSLLRDQPDRVAGLVRAVHRGLRDSIASADTAMNSVIRRDALIDRNIEQARLLYALKSLVLTPETTEIGVGDVRDERMTRAIAQVGEAFGLSRLPAAEEVFDRRFLPARSDRLLKLP